VSAVRTLVLFGDSILDNGPYTRPEPDTADHLRRILGPEWSVELLARDGAVMRSLPSQLGALRGTPSLAVLSIGGNDVTRHIGLLTRRVRHAPELLDELLAIADEFEGEYERSARAVAARAERTLLCTIYETPLEPPALARVARVPLALLDDRIVRVGARLGLDVLELRSVCTEPADFVLQIEPSARGAAKIARAIAAVARGGGGLDSGRVCLQGSPP